MGEELLKAKSDILKALAHPTRIQILELLREGERCVCEIMAELGLEQSNASQHLGVLRKEDLVGSRKDGLRVNYWVKHKGVFAILEATEKLLKDRIDKTATLLDELRPG